MAKATGLLYIYCSYLCGFIQGYRFLDRCGESLIALENTLAPGWIPTKRLRRLGRCEMTS